MLMKRLTDVANGRDNNFNLLRMIAASAVLVSHAYPLAIGNGAIVFGVWRTAVGGFGAGPRAGESD